MSDVQVIIDHNNMRFSFQIPCYLFDLLKVFTNRRNNEMQEWFIKQFHALQRDFKDLEPDDIDSRIFNTYLTMLIGGELQELRLEIDHIKRQQKTAV